MSSNRAFCGRSTLWLVALILSICIANTDLLGQQEAAEPIEDQRERLVFLTTGRIVTGVVSRNSGGYLVEQNNGRLQLASEDVKFVVNSLRDGYYKQRDSVVEPTPATHLALANWCISYRLYDEASTELRKCLKTDPDNEQARRLLQRLTELIRSSNPPTAADPAVRKTSEGFIQPEVESLGGLSHDDAVQFTTRIQPLLINKCGNAACHGPTSDNGFRINSNRISGRGSRLATERNLAEVLRQVDYEKASQSKLLVALQGAHGGRGAVFTGPSASAQMKTLRTWLVSVVDAKRVEADELNEQPRLADRGSFKKRSSKSRSKEDSSSRTAVRQASAETETDQDAPPDQMESAPPKELPPDAFDAAELAKEPEDAFDPEIFNQRFRQR